MSEFKGKVLVAVREYYEKNGAFLPTQKGTLTDFVQAFRSRSGSGLESMRGGVIFEVTPHAVVMPSFLVVFLGRAGGRGGADDGGREGTVGSCCAKSS